MRTGNGVSIFLVVAMVGAVTWALLRAALPPQVPHSPGPDTAPTVFTPAHRTAIDAVREFFNARRPPIQPIAFAHNIHLAQGMQCTDCHVGADSGPDAAIPGVQVCMTCHQGIAKDRPEIKKVAAYLVRGEEIPWQRVYAYFPSQHVKFNHAPHVRAGIDCKNCHGDMKQQTVAVRAVDLTMGYCIGCHRARKASTDCLTCHY